MSYSCLRFVMPDGGSRQLVIDTTLSPSTVVKQVRRAFGTGQGIELEKKRGSSMYVDDPVLVKPMPAPPALCDNLDWINDTRLGMVMQVTPRIVLEPRIIYAFRSLIAVSRQLLMVTVDIGKRTVTVATRPTEEVKRTDKSEDPLFDRAALLMLNAFDARRVVPTLVVTTSPISACLFLNPLPWCDDVACCGRCGRASCVCGLCSEVEPMLSASFS